MKYLFTTILVLLMKNLCFAQTFSDKQTIYNAILDSFTDKKMPTINQTVIGFAPYDLDGDYEKWFYKRERKLGKDSSLIVVHSICANPIKYTQSVTNFISVRGFDADTAFFHLQFKKSELDSLSKYISSRELTNCKYRPTPTSYFWNLFYKKRQAVALSKIIFNKTGNIGVIKMQYFSKSDMHKDNPSKILVYSKNAYSWSLLGIIEEVPL
jgi:hypothetical protein